MPITFWIFLLLIVWIWTLKNRIGELEKQIQNLHEKFFDLAGHVSDRESITKGSSEVEDAARAESTASAIAESAAPEVHIKESPEETLSIPPTETVPEDNHATIDILPEYSDKAMQTDTEVPEPIEAAAAPSQPSWLMRTLTHYFTGGNLLVRIGGVVLFFGLAFLVKYAAAHSHVSLATKLVMVGLSGLVMIAAGWKLRRREGAYGQILQGLGVAVMYLVLYGAAKYFGVLSVGAAFGGMIAITLLGILLALLQESQPLALFASAGGFLAPILTSDGTGSHVVLFSYYTLLNLGILIIAWKKAWRWLNIVGFLFTFIIGTSWGVMRYSPDMFATTEPFLILFFFIYLAVTILFVYRSENHWVDAVILFGLPASIFPLQHALVESYQYGAGYSAVGLGILYGGLYRLLRGKSPSRLMEESFLGLSVLFFTVAIPYFFDADITAALWAFESAATVYLGLRQGRNLGRYTEEILLVASTGIYAISTWNDPLSFGLLLGYGIVLLANLFVAYLLHLYRSRALEAPIGRYVFLALGLLVWWIAGVRIAHGLPSLKMAHIMSLDIVLGGLLIALAMRWVRWRLLSEFIEGVLPFSIVTFLLSWTGEPLCRDVMAGLGGWNFVAILLGGYLLLYRYGHRWRGGRYGHIALLWFGLSVAGIAGCHAVRGDGAWTAGALVMLALPGTAAALGLMRFMLPTRRFAPYSEWYRRIGIAGILVVLAGWQLAAMTFDACTIPWTYVPTANILDVAALTIVALSIWWVRRYVPDSRPALAVCLLAVAVLSSIYLRAACSCGHHPYGLSTLFHDRSVLMGMAILWTVGVGVMTWLHTRLQWYTLFEGSSVLMAGVGFYEIWAMGYAPLADYIPIVNRLDLTQIGIIAVSLYWVRHFRMIGRTGLGIYLLSAAVLTTIYLRYAAHDTGTSYHLYSLLRQENIQHGVALLWIAIVALSAWAGHRLQSALLFAGSGVLLAGLGLYELKALGDLPGGEHYLPLFNALDLLQFGIVGIALWWLNRLIYPLKHATRRMLWGGAALMGLVVLSAVFARAVHLYRETPYTLHGLWHDLYFQSGISILWSVVAIGTMLLSKHLANRTLWSAGFGLLGVIVAKLFFVELAGSGTIERIVSFIVVGLLLLLIGYFVPMPPEEKGADGSE